LRQYIAYMRDFRPLFECVYDNKYIAANIAAWTWCRAAKSTIHLDAADNL